MAQGHIAVGASTGVASIGAGASSTFTLNVAEPCVLQHVVIESDDISCIVIDEVTVNNDKLTSGEPPAGLFSPDSIRNPPLGRYVEPSSTITVTVTNRHASSAKYVGVGMLTTKILNGNS